MPLDPQCRAICEAAAQAGSPFAADDPQAVRTGYAATTAVYTHPTPPLDSIANLAFAGAEGNLRARVYRPRDAAAPAPVLVFLHGGGWSAGDLDTHDHVCRYLAARAGAVVAAIDYRLAPEHRFPAAFEDARAALHWIHADAAELGLDTARVAVGGDSAGGNLAAALAVAARDEGLPPLKLQLLVYPALDLTADNDSLRENGEGYLLTRDAMEQFMGWYLPDRLARSDPRASPRYAPDHSGLAPAFVQAAEFDPLRDEARDYAALLEAAGVPVTYKCYDGMIHGFMRMGARVDAAFAALDDAADALRAAFGTA